MGTPFQQSDSGQLQYPDYGPTISGTVYPMQSYNGLETWKTNRRPSQSDVDNYPFPVRRFTNMSMTDVQLNNGLQRGIASGRRIGLPGSGYLYAVQPMIPGQTRDNAAGYHRRGPSPYTVQDIWQSGPGSQPAHPGGPGKIAAPRFINPMTGLVNERTATRPNYAPSTRKSREPQNQGNVRRKREMVHYRRTWTSRRSGIHFRSPI